MAATSPAFTQLPPTQPTQPQPTPAPAPPAPQQAALHRPEVTFATGQLSISADNSSLNQILREISRVTGMKITGGVTDERVYGTYGPADPSTVLSALLRGTGSNMLIIFDRQQTPQELILTSRGGGPTPPSPMSAGRDERDRDDDMPPSRQPRVSRAGNVATPPAVATPAPQPVPAPSSATTPDAASSADTTPKSPNGVSTPEEIYQQLIKLQQQSKTPPPNSGTPH